MAKIQKRFIYDSGNKRYNTIENYLSLIEDDINTQLSNVDSSVQQRHSIDETTKATLTKDASTYLTVGNQQTDLKVIVDYVIRRDSIIEDGIFTLLNNDSSVSFRKDSNGDAEFKFETRYFTEIDPLMNEIQLVAIDTSTVGNNDASISYATKAIKKLTEYTPLEMSPVVLTIDFDGTTQFVFEFKAPATSTLVFNYSDGTKVEVAGNDTTEVTHTSTLTTAGTYQFWITGDVLDLTYIKVASYTGASGNIGGWASIPNIAYIQFNTTSLSVDVAEYANKPLITAINGNSSLAYGNIELLSGSTNLINLRLSFTLVTGDLSTLHTLDAATLFFRGTAVTFDNIVSFSLGGVSLVCSDCEWTSAMVDNCLISLFNGSTTGKTINIGGTNAARTPASDEAFAYLDANNTLTVNSY